MIRTETFQEIIGNSNVLKTPAIFADETLLDEYLKRYQSAKAQGSPIRDPLYLGIGETWTEIAPGLREIALQSSPIHLNGYPLSQYGIPYLRKVLREYLPKSYRLPESFTLGEDFEISVAANGTRGGMFDFGRLVQDEFQKSYPDKTPVALVPAPGWDYSGVFQSLGYEIKYFPLRRKNDFQPEPDTFLKIIEEIDRSPGSQLALIVINAQHNPTGANWSETEVKRWIQTALERKVALLIDDAYFSLVDPSIKATSSLEILANELKGGSSNRIRWLNVRSLGKQFHCNGWGIGALCSSPETLKDLVSLYQLSRSFVYSPLPQSWLAQWLEKSESIQYSAEKAQAYQSKRGRVASFLRNEMGFPEEAFFQGVCTSYMLFEVPHLIRKKVQKPIEEVDKFRSECFNKTGVLLANGSPPFCDRPYLRIFMGPQQKDLDEALLRFKEEYINAIP